MAGKGIRITSIEAGSLASRLGLAAGDEILTVNSRPVPDELALRFHLAEEVVAMVVRKAGGVEREFHVDLSKHGHLGIEVEDFETRTCNNSCMFCFIDQLPPDVRPSLKVRDDDYRLSFLHGNYVTLTNLADRELDRIVEQALSPLYVSVHATDPMLRTRILGRRKVDDLDRKLTKLIAGRITLHTQIVLMPGINDGRHLHKTVWDLYRYYPGVETVAIVPLGLSDHGRAREHFQAVTSAFCREVIRQVEPWQKQFRSESGRTFAYLADEFYIQGSLPIPDSEYYDDFAQIEDGIGMVRRFLSDFDEALPGLARAGSKLSGTLVTGELFAPFLQDCLVRLNERHSSRLRIAAAENLYLGRGITVAGLLGGRDIIRAVKPAPAGDFVIIPQETISRLDGALIDNWTPSDIAREVGAPVHPSGRTVQDFFRLLRELA